MASPCSADPLTVAPAAAIGDFPPGGLSDAIVSRVATKSGRQSKTFFQRAFRTLAATGPGTILGLVILGLMIVLCALAPIIAPHDPTEMNMLARLQGPSWQYPLGTDGLGRCILTRLLYGGQISLGVSFLVTIATTLIGSVIGLASAMSSKLVDEAIMRFVDIVLAFPPVILVLVIAGLLKPDLTNLALALIIVGWSPFARLARIQAMVVKQREFVEAAICTGASSLRVAFRHIFPNVLGPLLALSFLRLGFALLSLAGLSFLGLGAQPPTPEWGVMLNEARRYMSIDPLVMLAPGATIFLATLSVSIAGEGLRMVLDPTHR